VSKGIAKGTDGLGWRHKNRTLLGLSASRKNIKQNQINCCGWEMGNAKENARVVRGVLGFIEACQN